MYIDDRNMGFVTKKTAPFIDENNGAVVIRISAMDF